MVVYGGLCILSIRGQNLPMSLETLHIGADETTASQLEKELREAIVRLELLPGQKLSEQEIATRYGVSRQPVREALIALAKSNLVEIRPHRGTVVVRISIKDMMEARFVREAVERAVVRRACQSFDSWTRERIEINLSQQAKAIEDGNHNNFRMLDGQFHIMIAKGAGCSLAWTAIADMKVHMDRVCNITLTYPHAREPLLQQHRDIMAAIDARDAHMADAHMGTHLQSILANISELEEARPDLFA